MAAREPVPSSWPRVALLALGACVLWSTAFVGVKYGLGFARPLSFAGMRFVLSGVLLLPLVRGQRQALAELRRGLRTVLLVTLFQSVLLYASFFVGMTLVSGALGAIVVGSSPLVAAVVAHFAMDNDEMTLPKAAAIAGGMIGVCIISLSRQPWTAAGLRELLGVVLLVLGAVFSAVGNVLVARDRRRIHPVVLSAAQFLLGGAVLTAVSLPIEGPPRLALPWAFWGTLFYLALLSAVAFSIWFSLLAMPGVKVSELNLWKFVIPVFGALFSWLLLPGEKPEPLTVLGMLCVACSVLAYGLTVARRGSAEVVASPPPAAG
ncbi:MAG: DMT family transporter [Calditrichaeota bacterium]|nr:DMT family transporter [Calditrichota bacterium]